MARTVQEIKKQITTAFLSYPIVRTAFNISTTVNNDEFESVFAKSSVTSILFYIIAFALHTLERIFDVEKAKLTEYAESLRPHTKQWYVNILKAFQLGHAFNETTEKYDVTDETAQIIKYCSLREESGELYFLIAKENDNVPQKINEGSDMTAIRQYAGRVFDAGAHFVIASKEADIYKCSILINYDALVLDGQGKRLDGTNNTPVLEAIQNYFKSFPFDSEFSNMALTDAIQQVEGVRIVQIVTSEAKPNTSTATFRVVESVYIAEIRVCLTNRVLPNY